MQQAEAAKAAVEKSSMASGPAQDLETQPTDGGTETTPPSNHNDDKDGEVSEHDDSSLVQGVNYFPSRRVDREALIQTPSFDWQQSQTNMHTKPDFLPTISHDKWKLMRKLEPNQQDVLKQAAGIDVLRPVHGQATDSVKTNHFLMDFYDNKGSRVLYVYRVDGISPDGARAKKRTNMHTAIEKCAPLRSNKHFIVTDNISKIVVWMPLAEEASPGDEIAKIPLIDYDRRDNSSS
ncbi:hypothetical protein LTR78_007725 [Recurvomyces mirabilis]|uniref:Uncharacterized protein n=1 Tax=Recurvomyces mirabilis TaxID=574656 RepID=A0AAE0TSP1_9PEZI|nr:hypothetical protein LTR78_007725 [Recurvomyces mirabilis]KAK5151612.1 hypothetical protein LTS14_009099 [Recurvomyces mirabilis]